jgi:hypothetical protein
VLTPRDYEFFLSENYVIEERDTLNRKTMKCSQEPQHFVLLLHIYQPLSSYH